MTPLTQTSSEEPRTLGFICRICGREDFVDYDEEYRRGTKILRDLGLNYSLPTVCQWCDDEMRRPRTMRGEDGQTIHLPPRCLDDMLARHRRPKKRPALNVPAEFMDTDPGQLPDRAAYEKVQKWKRSKRGLVLHGPSGSGKSRSAWALLARLWGEGDEVAGHDAQKIVDEYEEKRKKGWGPWYTQQLCAAGMLLIDDLGNEEWGDGLMMHIIKTRAEKGRPTIVTTQHTSSTLYPRAKNRERVAALVRRLRDHYEPVTFRKEERGQ